MAQVIKLFKRGTDKTGNTSYARPGVRASIYFNKQMFAGEPPAEILLDCENLAEPGEAKPGVDSAEKAQKAQERAQKAQARAAKALAAAAKAQERAAKYASNKPVAQPEGAPVEV